MNGERWTDDAACLGLDTNLFYPSSLEGMSDSDKRAEESMDKVVRRVCQDCPVRQACLEWALARNERYGYWGGTTPQQRTRMRRAEGVSS